jgi:hypothetical protein
VADAAEDLELVGLQAHAGAASVALTATSELVAQGVGGHEQARGDTFDDDGERRPV